MTRELRSLEPLRPLGRGGCHSTVAQSKDDNTVGYLMVMMISSASRIGSVRFFSVESSLALTDYPERL